MDIYRYRYIERGRGRRGAYLYLSAESSSLLSHSERRKKKIKNRDDYGAFCIHASSPWYTVSCLRRGNLSGDR